MAADIYLTVEEVYGNPFELPFLAFYQVAVETAGFFADSD